MKMILDPREWVTKAQCNGRNPRLYDVDKYRYEKFTPAQHRARARDLCSGCPVVRECAADALQPLAEGTIRGGVWIEFRRNTAAVKAQLTAVALGKSVASGGA